MASTSQSYDIDPKYSAVFQQAKGILFPWVHLSQGGEDSLPELHFGVSTFFTLDSLRDFLIGDRRSFGERLASNVLEKLTSTFKMTGSASDDDTRDRICHAINHHVQVSIAQRFVELKRSGQMIFDLGAELEGFRRQVIKATEWAGSSFSEDKLDVHKYEWFDLDPWAEIHTRLPSEALECYKLKQSASLVETLLGTEHRSQRTQYLGFRLPFASQLANGRTRLDATWSPEIRGRSTDSPTMTMFARFVYEGEGEATLAEPFHTACKHGETLSDEQRSKYKQMSEKAWIKAEQAVEDSGLLKDFNGHIDADRVQEVLRQQHRDIFAPL